jgi:hypothetical protein
MRLVACMDCGRATEPPAASRKQGIRCDECLPAYEERQRERRNRRRKGGGVGQNFTTEAS